MCNHCKSIVSTVSNSSSNKSVICRTCETHKYIKTVPLPFVFKYLVAELTAMNIKVMLDVK